jgi:DNA repair exonuclease SbcCD nuclease subunit
MIVVGDLHLKSKEIYWSAQKKFLNWLQENYNNEIILFLGDIFDSSSPMWEVYCYFKEFLTKRLNKTFILVGNHDISRVKGCSLTALNLMQDVFVFEKETDIKIEDYKCLMLPYQNNMDHYSELTGNYDFIFTHIMPKEESFGGEYTDISKLIGKKIYGHIHLKRDYPDAYILGVPVISRNLETNNPIIEITSDKQIKEIVPPVFFNIVDLEYGKEISNKDWFYNIKKAPSIKSVYETYPAYNIREDGIEILYESDGKEINLSGLENDLKFLYKSFCDEKEIEKIYVQEGLTILNECTVI